MLARQADAGCSDDYRVQAGDPCVPAGTGDTLSCGDLDATNIEVVGTDVHDLDGDGDGIACDDNVPLGAITTTTAPPPRATQDSPDGTDVGAFLRPAGVVLALGLGIAGAVLLWREFRQAEGAGRRNILVGLYMGAALGAIPVALGILRWA